METAAEVSAALGLRPHPEGGRFNETWRAAGVNGQRPAASAILYLLAAGERSHWHRVDAAEVWHHASGGPLRLRVWSDGDTSVHEVRLGDDVLAGDQPHAVVPAGAWQSAEPIDSWTLVGCIVAPAFEFEGFELAPEGWEPPASNGR